MSESRLPDIVDFAHAEHHVLEDLTQEHPSLDAAFDGPVNEARVVSDEIVIRDKLRGRQTTVRIYEEGWVDIEVERRGRNASHHRIDLRFLDPASSRRRYHPSRLIRIAGIVAAVTAVCSIPVWFGWILSVAVPAVVVGSIAAVAVLFTAFYLSHEKIAFKTLHGRADAIRFGAGLGTIRRFRKLVPLLQEAIAGAAEAVHDQTMVYLRAEMREHYRLRSDGILSEDECAASTGKILGEFDGTL